MKISLLSSGLLGKPGAKAAGESLRPEGTVPLPLNAQDPGGGRSILANVYPVLIARHPSRQAACMDFSLSFRNSDLRKVLSLVIF